MPELRGVSDIIRATEKVPISGGEIELWVNWMSCLEHAAPVQKVSSSQVPNVCSDKDLVEVRGVL